jgi:hypothetical protein
MGGKRIEELIKNAKVDVKGLKEIGLSNVQDTIPKLIFYIVKEAYLQSANIKIDSYTMVLNHLLQALQAETGLTDEEYRSIYLDSLFKIIYNELDTPMNENISLWKRLTKKNRMLRSYYGILLEKEKQEYKELLNIMHKLEDDLRNAMSTA